MRFPPRTSQDHATPPFSSKSAPERKIYMIKEHEERRTIRSTKRALYYHPVPGWRSKKSQGGRDTKSRPRVRDDEWMNAYSCVFFSKKRGGEDAKLQPLRRPQTHTHSSDLGVPRLYQPVWGCVLDTLGFFLCRGIFRDVAQMQKCFVLRTVRVWSKFIVNFLNLSLIMTPYFTSGERIFG